MSTQFLLFLITMVVVTSDIVIAQDFQNTLSPIGFDELRSPTGSIIGYFTKGKGAKLTENLAIFLPPATGKIATLLQEAAAFSDNGLSSLVLLPPYTRSEFDQFPRGPENPEGEVQFWNLNAIEICDAIADIRKSHGLAGKTILLGKNLGGSFAAYVSTKCTISALFTFGSVPSLSKFWLNSNHPKAKAFREGREKLVLRFSELTQSLDLSYSLFRSRVPSLLQFGTKDDWIDPEQQGLIMTLPRKVIVKWYTDDHEMDQGKTKQDRLRFAI